MLAIEGASDERQAQETGEAQAGAGEGPVSLSHAAIYLTVLATFLLPIVAVALGIRWLVRRRRRKLAEKSG